MPDWAREPTKADGFVALRARYGGANADYEKRYPKFFDSSTPKIRSQRDLDERHTAHFRRFAAERFFDQPLFFSGLVDFRDRAGQSWHLEIVFTGSRFGVSSDPDRYEPGSFPIDENSAGIYLALRITGPKGTAVFPHVSALGALSPSGDHLYSFIPSYALESATGITAIAVEIPFHHESAGDLRLQIFPSKAWEQTAVTWKELGE